MSTTENWMRTTLRWLPLGLALVLAASAALAATAVTSGHAGDREAVAELVAQHEQKANSAEQDYLDGWEAVLSKASPVQPSRVLTDREAGEALLTDLLDGSIMKHEIDDESRAALSEAFAEHGGELQSFSAVPTATQGSKHSYIATFESESARGVLEYTVDDSGAFTGATVAWADGAPRRS